ncbi:MAG: sugar phosphate isomerase/epimerase [Chlorobi bacterium]|nr:sugar phosphate isomerase/epimerase [Chlorobiota bacterium]
MKRKRNIILVIAALFISLTGMQSCKKPKTAEDLGWKLAVQAWTFNKYSFQEAVEKTKALGLKYIEAYSNQPLGENYAGTTNYNEGPEARRAMKEILEKNGITLINYGVVSADSMAEWKKIFDFAKEMGIQTLTAEPTPEQMDSVGKLCDAYQINIAIHNHPQPSFYWNPDKVLENIQGQTSRIGACADVGHWVRSGLDPVECLKKLEGHIISIHMKDVNEKSPEAHDVIWGTGVCNVKGILEELHRQNFKGVFSIEYEYNWENSIPDIEKSVNYFNKVIASF